MRGNYFRVFLFVISINALCGSGICSAATIFLDPGDHYDESSISGSFIYGAGGTEEVTFLNALGVTLDQNIECAVFKNALTAYTFSQTGNVLNVYSGSKLVAVIPVQPDATGTQLTFISSSANAVLVNGSIRLGDAVLVEGALPVHLVPSSSTITTGQQCLP